MDCAQAGLLEPAEARDDVRATRPHGIAVAAPGLDPAAAAPLDGVIGGQDDGPALGEDGDDQAEEDLPECRSWLRPMTRRTEQTVRLPVARMAPTARRWALIQTGSEASGAKAAKTDTISGGRSKGVRLRERWLVYHHRSWPATSRICQPTWPKSSGRASFFCS